MTTALTAPPTDPNRSPCIPVQLAEPRMDGDPVCPMTGTTNCDGADATKCTAC